MDSIFFYFFGAIIALHKDFFIKIDQRISQTITIIFIALYFVCLIDRTIYFCYQDPNYLLIGDPNILLDISQKICIPLGMFAFWYSYDLFFKKRDILWRVSKYSFLLFAAHHPLVSVVKKLIFKYIGYTELNSVICYFVSAAITVGIEMFRYALLGQGEINLLYIAISWAVTILVLFFGIMLFNKVERTFMDTV